MKKAGLQLNLSIVFLREGKRFVAYSPALDLSTSGKTFAEAKKRFAEAVKIFFEEIKKRGTMDEVLEELGWHKSKKEWESPIFIGQELESVRVPA